MHYAALRITQRLARHPIAMRNAVDCRCAAPAALSDAESSFPVSRGTAKVSASVAVGPETAFRVRGKKGFRFGSC